MCAVKEDAHAGAGVGEWSGAERGRANFLDGRSSQRTLDLGEARSLSNGLVTRRRRRSCILRSRDCCLEQEIHTVLCDTGNYGWMM